jgi:hypothetical protein
MHRRLLVAFDVVFRGFCCVLPLMMSARASKAKPKRRRSMTGKKTAPHIQGPIRRCDYAMHQGSIISPPGGLPLLPILGWCGRDTTPHRPPAHHRRQRQGRQAHGSAATTPYSIILPYLGLLRVGYGCPTLPCTMMTTTTLLLLLRPDALCPPSHLITVSQGPKVGEDCQGSGMPTFGLWPWLWALACGLVGLVAPFALQVT